MSLILFASFASFIIAILAIIIALMPGIFQKKPDLEITFSHLEKFITVSVGVKRKIAFRVYNKGEIALIDEIFFCIPAEFQDIVVPEAYLRRDEFGRGLITYNIRPDICDGIDYLAVIFLRYGWPLPKKTITVFEISFKPQQLGTYKIPVVINARVDVSGLKFPFRYMVNRPERIREELTIEVVSGTQNKL